MRNFARVIKHSLTYRRRLVVSALCALCVAGCWGLNLTAIYPVLKILGSGKDGGKNLQEWVESEIDSHRSHSEDPIRLKEISDIQAYLSRVDNEPEYSGKDEVRRKYTIRLADLQGKQEHDLKWLWRYQLLRDHCLRHFPTDRFATVCWIMLIVVVGVAIKGVFEFGQEALVGTVVARTLFDIRNNFYRAALHQDFRLHAEAGTPELMSRFTNDAEQLGNGMKMLYGRVVLEPLKAIACVVAACFISWQLTMTFLIVIAFAFFFLSKITRSMKRATRRVFERMSDIFRILRESFDGIKVVKAFTMEPYERRRFRRATEEYYRKTMRVTTLDAFAGPVVELLGVFAVGLVLVAGAYLVINQQTRIFGMNMVAQEMGFEALLQLYILLLAIAEPARKLSSVFSKIQAGAVAADRIYNIFDKVPNVLPNAEGPVIPRDAKTIEFRNVCFSYTPGNETLADINLMVKTGETIALVGANGCGKSTLLGLMPRFYDPDFGAILVDGINLRGANLRSLRKQIGLVTQDTVLFDDSLFNNIAYGKPGASKEDVEAASKKAFAHEFIITLPQGYETPAGEMGSKLSGGQKQRIALARAILRDPRILILDEFTSQVDAESEAKIHLALKDFVKGRTTFLITHRMAALDLADRVVMMDAGRITAVGTVSELMKTSDAFKRLSDAQTKIARAA